MLSLHLLFGLPSLPIPGLFRLRIIFSRLWFCLMWPEYAFLRVFWKWTIHVYVAEDLPPKERWRSTGLKWAAWMLRRTNSNALLRQVRPRKTKARFKTTLLRKSTLRSLTKNSDSSSTLNARRSIFHQQAQKNNGKLWIAKYSYNWTSSSGRAFWSTNLPLSVTSTGHVLTPSGLNNIKPQENLRKKEGSVRWKTCESRRKT